MMSDFKNLYGQPVGAPLPNWTVRLPPPRTPKAGRYCRLEPLDPTRHANDLIAAFAAAPDDRDWTYLPIERPADRAAFRAELEQAAVSDDALAFAVLERATNRAQGLASYLRIDPPNGSIEVGAINFSPVLMHTRIGTEAMFLMMCRAFDELGYRRYEWKCDALNAPSRAAAERYGFRFEGIFRQAIVTKGRNRDTAWYAILDREWPAIRRAFETWLVPDNFAPDGQQRVSLNARASKAEHL
jgi:RimJ/RimL family protein N-acetyltransferase